ncbi:MAG TPA: reverse transcriptase family protein [Candidatus Paceibacterota bacterium]|nr:reverse transcriptase family protein [Candidatus Paceibacterota bacterium]
MDPTVLAHAIEAGKQVIAVNPALRPVFTLRHLCHLAGVNYARMRELVERAADDGYRVFTIKKRPNSQGGRRFRVICAPDPSLMRVQRWIATNILNQGTSLLHPANTAFAPGSKLMDAAAPHCGCRWMVKLDVKNFFESISEISAYRSFRRLGYQPLVSFEMARICSRLGTVTSARSHPRWQARRHWDVITTYSNHRVGHLPQGAPTSPMLANMAVAALDEQLTAIASQFGLNYTRYADDLTFSTRQAEFNRTLAGVFIRQAYKALAGHGLSPNVTKTQVVPPGARKVVLGLLVDQDTPRLTRDFKSAMRMHLHFLLRSDVGPAKHAQARGFSAVAGLRNHLRGLVAYAAQIEPDYASHLAGELARVSWPV